MIKATSPFEMINTLPFSESGSGRQFSVRKEVFINKYSKCKKLLHGSEIW